MTDYGVTLLGLGKCYDNGWATTVDPCAAARAYEHCIEFAGPSNNKEAAELFETARNKCSTLTGERYTNENN